MNTPRHTPSPAHPSSWSGPKPPNTPSDPVSKQPARPSGFAAFGAWRGLAGGGGGGVSVGPIEKVVAAQVNGSAGATITVRSPFSPETSVIVQTLDVQAVRELNDNFNNNNELTVGFVHRGESLTLLGGKMVIHDATAATGNVRATVTLDEPVELLQGEDYLYCLSYRRVSSGFNVPQSIYAPSVDDVNLIIPDENSYRDAAIVSFTKPVSESTSWDKGYLAWKNVVE